MLLYGGRVLFQDDINGFRANQMIQNKALSAENAGSLVEDGEAVLKHLANSLWASRERVVSGIE